jgi:hypothetical protein
MKAQLTEGLRQAIDQHGGTPLYIADPVTKSSYFVRRAEQFERLKAAIGDAAAAAMYRRSRTARPKTGKMPAIMASRSHEAR